MCDYLLYCSKFTWEENLYFGIFDVLLCFSTASASLKLIVFTLQNISSRNIKKKNTSKYHFIRTCTAVRLYCKTDIEMRNEGMQWKKNNKLKQTNMLVSAGCELVVIDDKCPIIRDLESPISSAVILQICILNWPCSVAVQCTVSGVFHWDWSNIKC